MEFLSHMNFDVLYRKGTLMGKLDALTRSSELQGGSRASESAPKALLGAEKFKTPVSDFDLPPNTFSLAPINGNINPPEMPYTDLLQRILTAQESDDNCKPIRTLLKNMDVPFTLEELELTKGFTLSEDDLLLYNNRLYVPNDHDVKIQILQQCHDTALSGQLGRAKTYSLVARHYHWPGMRAFINTYVKGCDTCQRNKTPRHLPVGLLQALPIPSGPWRSISIDAIVKLPKSDSYDSIMVIVCRLTKMSHFLPFNEEGFTSEHLATMFNFIFRLHGIPQDIVSDSGPIFTSKFWRAFCSGLGIKLNFSTAYHPQSDGQIERVNQVLEQYLRMFVNYQQDNWCQLLPKAEFTYNNTEHASTKMTPFFANNGYHPLEPSCPLVPQGNPSAESRINELVKIRETLHNNIAKAQADYAKHYNRKVKSHLDLADEPVFKVGDKVWLNAKDIATSRPSRKLDHKLLGPIRITKKISDLAYRLDLPPTMDINRSKKLLPYSWKENVNTYPSESSMVPSTNKHGSTSTSFTGKDIPNPKTPGNPSTNLNISRSSRDSETHMSTLLKCFRLRKLRNPKTRISENANLRLKGLRLKQGGAVMNGNRS
jgi:hypothetical protein